MTISVAVFPNMVIWGKFADIFMIEDTLVNENVL